MRSSAVCATIMLLVFPLSAVGGTSLVNGSFEDNYNGWTISWTAGKDYAFVNPPMHSCETWDVGRTDYTLPVNPPIAPQDGQHFAGLIHAGGVEPVAGQPSSAVAGEVRFRQVIDVSNYSANANRTNYDFQIWAVLAAAQDGFTDGNVAQSYAIYWQDDGGDFLDNLTISALPLDGDTITIDVGGAHQRIYEFSTDTTLQNGGNVRVDLSGATDAVDAAISLYNTIQADTSGPCVPDNRFLISQGRIILKWKYTSGPSNGVQVVTNAPARINVADNGIFKSVVNWTYGYNHEYHLGSDDDNYSGGGADGGAGFFNDQAFARYGQANGSDNANPQWAKWRKVHLTGSVPGKPGQVVLEIRIDSGDVTEYNCFDNVSFRASSVTASSILGTFTSDINNGDFEQPADPGGFDQTYTHWSGEPYIQPWLWGIDPNWQATTDPPPDAVYMYGFDVDLPSHYNGPVNGGPLETYTTGHSTPTNAMGIAAASGSHFMGRNQPGTNLGSGELDGYWGKVLPVHNWSASAIGFRWRIHYYTKMYQADGTDGVPRSYQWLEFCWDAGGTWGGQSGNTGAFPSILDYPADFLVADTLLSTNSYCYIRPLNLYKLGATPGSNLTSDWDEIEQIGEFSPVGENGEFWAPPYVLVRHYDRASSEDSTMRAFSQLYDKIDITVEAMYDTAVICSTSPLPSGTCTADYSQQLCGSGAGSVTWSLDSGALPPGLTLTSSGLINGRPTTAGTFTFTVKLHDTSPAPGGTDVTQELQITIDVASCCNSPRADLDGDHDVDQADFAFLQACFTGTDGGVPVGCACADLDADSLSVDQADLAVFESCASGPGILASPSCQ